LDVGGFSIQIPEVAASRFSQRVVECYHAKKNDFTSIVDYG